MDQTMTATATTMGEIWIHVQTHDASLYFYIFIPFSVHSAAAAAA